MAGAIARLNTVGFLPKTFYETFVYETAQRDTRD